MAEKMAKKTDPTIGATAFALFALQQELDLNAIRSGSQAGELASADADSPDWFAAAASRDASLMDTAPELQNGQPDDSVAGSSQPGLDLVRMYAPELAALENATQETISELEQSALPDGKHPATPKEVDPATMSIQIGLLRELEEFDV